MTGQLCGGGRANCGDTREGELAMGSQVAKRVPAVASVQPAKEREGGGAGVLQEGERGARLTGGELAQAARQHRAADRDADSRAEVRDRQSRQMHRDRES